MKKMVAFYALLLPAIIFAQQKVEAKDFYNKPLSYDFKGGSIKMIIYSDSTLYWKNESKGTEGREKSKTIHIDRHTVLTAWQETDKTFVSLLSDFENRKV